MHQIIIVKIYDFVTVFKTVKVEEFKTIGQKISRKLKVFETFKFGDFTQRCTKNSKKIMVPNYWDNLIAIVSFQTFVTSYGISYVLSGLASPRVLLLSLIRFLIVSIKQIDL